MLGGGVSVSMIVGVGGEFVDEVMTAIAFAVKEDVIVRALTF